MVTIRNLHKKYGSFEVLKGLNMDIRRGDVYGFLGRNGCGKTTTMNIIADIIPKDEGQIILGENGEKIKIGYLPESPQIFGYMTSREYLEYIAACCGYEGGLKRRASEVLEIVGLTDSWNRKSKGYSRGMIQRLGMGAAIIGNPDLLIFDEPTSALDPEGRAEVIEIINRLKGMGATIVLSTHILPDVEKTANRIGIMNNGVLAEEGYLKELLRKYSGDVITLKIRGLTQEKKLILLGADFARAEYNNNTDEFRFGADNPEECSVKLMKLMSDNNIVAESFKIGAASLDEVYGKVAGRSAN